MFQNTAGYVSSTTKNICAIGVDDIWWLLECHIYIYILYISHPLQDLKVHIITIHCRWVKSRLSLVGEAVGVTAFKPLVKSKIPVRISHVIPFHRGKFSSSSWNGSIRFYKSISPVFQWWGPSNAKKSTMAGCSQQSILKNLPANVFVSGRLPGSPWVFMRIFPWISWFPNNSSSNDGAIFFGTFSPWWPTQV